MPNQSKSGFADRFLWVLKMAWRDSRTYRKRLLLFTASIVLGTAALVAINSLRENLAETVSVQAKSLLGADLLIEKTQSYSKTEQAIFDSLQASGNDLSREISFASMVYFQKTGNTRLSEIRASEGSFPYYGKLDTEPASAAQTFQGGRNALVDEALLIQFNAGIGDSIKIGAIRFRITGRLKEIPGEAAFTGIVGPRVYIPMAYVDQTELIQPGSLTRHKVYLKLRDPNQVKAFVTSLKPRFDLSRTSLVTAEDRQQALGKAIENLYRFLNLTGFIALLLGSVGIASAVNVYVRQKLGTVAVLRCVGAESKETVAIYLVQAAVMGLNGALLGALLGVGIQFFLPALLSDFLPVGLKFGISWSAILQGGMISLGIALSFALLPLLSIRKVSPLLALRSSYEDVAGAGKDPLRWLVYGLIVIGVSLFAVFQVRSPQVYWAYGLLFPIAVGVSFGLLALVAKGVSMLLKKYFPASLPFVWRQGLANLFRPNNQTIILILSIGLGTFFITTLYFSQEALLKQVEFTDREGSPNLVLFDIQSDQKEGVEKLIRSFDMPVMQDIPVVTMRLAAVRDVRVSDLRRDSSLSRAYFWEYRATYRDTLTETEKIIDGKFHTAVTLSNPKIEVSVAEFLAKELKLAVGDSIVFDVQGVPIAATVASIRKVDFRRVQPNFSLVFPAGVLEQAPQFYAVVTRAPSRAASAKLQQVMAQEFPNVSSIDLSLILNTLNAVLGKVSLVIQFMAFFSIVTGLIVLASAVITSRYQRIQESVLLRSLGAVKRQVIQIMVIEYFFLGTISAIVGVGLALLGTWALSYFFFETLFVPAMLPILISVCTVIGLTILIGVLNSRGIHDRPPLEVLRVEAA